MSIQFKFRSSVKFDSVEIDGGNISISVGDLRSKIIRQKHLNVCQDFDLVFSDALTGQEYKDDAFQIPSGSSVIIKRVPAGIVPSAPEPNGLDANNEMKDLDLYAPASGEPDAFDDFGIELCPVRDGIFSDCCPELGQKDCTVSGNEYNAGSRSEWKLQASDLSEAVPRGTHSGAEGEICQKKLELEFNEPMKLEKVATANGLNLQNIGLPSELKCSLCNLFFKEAVMIPCCQHSFCEKCISQVLVAKVRCPKCSSSKCRVEDLLPNLSLRQAIEHFLESQNLTTGMDNALQKYAPDGESGIQDRDFSCAVTVMKKKPSMHCSPSATEKGSNQVMAESSYHALSSLRGRIFQREVVKPEDLAAVADSQGENLPVNCPQNYVTDEADSTINKRRGLWVDPGGVGRSFMVPGRNKKVDRTCYMCGSPDHFVRDCPVASSPRPVFPMGEAMFQGAMPGYAPPYWNGATFPPLSPYMNMYGNPGMLPFNANMVPVTPYTFPPYVPSMYGGFPIHGGIAKMGGMAPPGGTKAERPLNHSEFVEIRDRENRRMISQERRGQPFDYEGNGSRVYHSYDELERSDEFKSHPAWDRSTSQSEDSRGRSLHRKQRRDEHLDQHNYSVDERYEKASRSTVGGRDRRSYHSERSNSGVENIPHSIDRCAEARDKQHHKSSKRHHESRGQSGSDSSRSRHFVIKKLDVVDSKHKHYSHSSSGLGPCSSVDPKKGTKDANHRRSRRDSRDCSNHVLEKLSGDRWQMLSGSEDDCRDGYHHRKRKRVH